MQPTDYADRPTPKYLTAGSGGIQREMLSRSLHIKLETSTPNSEYYPPGSTDTLHTYQTSDFCAKFIPASDQHFAQIHARG